ncbi:MAG: DUF1634 domain-containing protein [Candidatus Aramenus sulfurataquae]|jgi:uncharacterized membrane protein|uniref:DUF1634 domain-containing protein n=2 Tax=Candidatus Aramenus sulfurataquae TaxID=1326980 RepID=A0A0F2LN15_9CREN|nr:DUF1634 domain-containing protein [Candidatus Aramenus sulfurataquae]
MDFEDLIGNTLRIGVIISSAFIILGSVLLFVVGHSNGYTLSQISSPKTVVNTSEFPPIQVAKGVEELQPIDLIFLGLMLLIAIQVVRVVLGIAQFASERNKLYTIITVIVFFNLMFAIFILPLLIGK